MDSPKHRSNLWHGDIQACMPHDVRSYSRPIPISVVDHQIRGNVAFLLFHGTLTNNLNKENKACIEPRSCYWGME